MKVTVGSASDRKIQVVKKVFESFIHNEKLEVVGHNTKSGVPDTPYDKETYDGARNRAKGSKETVGDSDYYVGLESGLVERYGHLYEEAWAIVIAANGDECAGYSSGLKVPDYITKRMKGQNMEHCDVMTLIEEEMGKQPNDTWGTYSGGQIAREISLEEALRNAIIQLMPREGSLYKI